MGTACDILAVVFGLLGAWRLFSAIDKKNQTYRDHWSNDWIP